MNCLLVALIVLQMIAMCFIIYTTYAKYKHDKKFWKQQEEISEEFLKQLRNQENQAAECLDEGVAACEQENTDKE